MEWAILYHTEGPFEEVVEQLKRHGYSPQVFCDPHCRELYMPELHKGTVKCPPQFYIAVPQGERLNAESVVKHSIRKMQQEHIKVKNSIFKKAIKALFFTLAILFVCCTLHPKLLIKAENSNHISSIIVLFALIWTSIFIFLVSRKTPSPKDQRDFTKPN